MSEQDITLELQERTVLGKGLNHLRKSGSVPAVIHDHGKPSINVMAEYQTIAKVYSEAGKHHPVQLTLGKRHDMAIIKDVHFNPVKHSIEHVVFQAIRQDEPIETEVPITLVGEVPAVKVGLLLIEHIDTVQVEALPKNLPDEVQVDATGLNEIGDRITVADIVIPSGVTMLTEPEMVIASIEEPKAMISEEAAEEEAETVEGEAATGDSEGEAKSDSKEEE